MSHNQTIDGVMVLRSAVTLVRSNEAAVKDAAIRELRALLDAPAKPVIQISLELLNTACNGFVQEQGHAINELREILSAHKADQNVKSTSVILDGTNSGNSSNWDSNICIKPIAAQPQGEPVAILSGPDDSVCWTQDNTPKELRKQVVLIEYADFLRLQYLASGAVEPVYQTRWNRLGEWEEWKTVSCEQYQRSEGRLFERRIVYAEQPAPVAVVPERLVMTDGLHTYEYVTGHNAAIDKMLGVKS